MGVAVKQIMRDCWVGVLRYDVIWRFGEGSRDAMCFILRLSIMAYFFE